MSVYMYPFYILFHLYFLVQRRNLCKLMVEEMKKAREEMIVMYQDLKAKRERSQILEDEMTKLPKNINRLFLYFFMFLFSLLSFH